MTGERQRQCFTVEDRDSCRYGALLGQHRSLRRCPGEGSDRMPSGNERRDGMTADGTGTPRHEHPHRLSSSDGDRPLLRLVASIGVIAC